MIGRVSFARDFTRFGCLHRRSRMGPRVARADDARRASLTARAEASARAFINAASFDAPMSLTCLRIVDAAGARAMYDALASQGFHARDVEDALLATAARLGGAFGIDDVLDRLCLDVANARLPRRFQTSERAEYKLDADALVEATAAPSDRTPSERAIGIPEGATAHARRTKDESDVFDDGEVDKGWITRYSAREASESESGSDDGYDSLDDFGLSDEEAAAKRLSWTRRRAFAKDPGGTVSQFASELASLKARASEAKRGKHRREQQVVAEAIRVLKRTASELGVLEDEIDPPSDVVVKDDERDRLGVDECASAADAVFFAQDDDANRQDFTAEIPEAKSPETDPRADESDEECCAFDVFGDDADTVIGTGEEDPMDTLTKLFKNEMLFSDGKRPQVVANAKGGKNAKDVSVSNMEKMTPKNMLTQLSKREEWHDPRFERVKGADGIRYIVSVERSIGRKYKRKPTLVCSTQADDEPVGGWATIDDAQNGAALRALFDATFTKENQIIPLELSANFRDLWRRWAIAYLSSDTANVSDIARDEFITLLMRSIGSSCMRSLPVNTESHIEESAGQAQARLVKDKLMRNCQPASQASAIEQTEASRKLKAELDAARDTQEWQVLYKKRSSLPITALKDELLDRLRSHDSVVVCGETGCGKTTQVPQFILDDAIDREEGQACNIVCTQPRRVAATSIAERVSFERCEKGGVGGSGSLVGHHVRLDAKVTNHTRLTFCTTGILLRRLQGDRMLSDVSHIVIDEVHERSLDGDFLLTLLKDLPRRRRDAGMIPVKLVLMSATLNAALFSDYLGGSPVISAPGRSFPVETVHLERIYDMLDYVIDPDNRSCRRPKGKVEDAMKAIKAGGGGDRRRQNELLASWGKDAATEFGGEDDPENPDFDPSKYEHCKKTTRLSLSRLDESVIDYDLIEDLLAYIDETTDSGAILVFLPGIGEVTGLIDRLASSPRFKQSVLTPLHSALTNAEQREAFKIPKPGVRKIVVATNVAETSVTIEDIVVVIDSGRVKERQWDPRRGMASLEEGWVSRAAGKQRAGRAGRVRPGTCYALFTSHRATSMMRPFQVPEMHRAPLTEVVLQIANLDLHDDPAFVLGNAPEPPSDEAIAAAKATLTEVGAFDDKGRLTPLGRHLAALPVDARVAKMLLFGAILRCLSPILTIAAALSYKSPFSSSSASNSQVEAAMRAFAQPASLSLAAGQQSDHLVIVAAYDGYIEAAKENRNSGRRFAQKNALDVDTIHQISEMRMQYAALLADMGVIKIPEGYSIRGRNTSWLDDPKAVSF